MHHFKSTSILWSINAYLSEVLYFLFIPKDKKITLYSVPSPLSSSSNSQRNQGSHSLLYFIVLSVKKLHLLAASSLCNLSHK